MDHLCKLICVERLCEETIHSCCSAQLLKAIICEGSQCRDERLPTPAAIEEGTDQIGTLKSVHDRLVTVHQN